MTATIKPCPECEHEMDLTTDRFEAGISVRQYECHYCGHQEGAATN